MMAQATTKNTLSEKTRTVVISLLNQQLADCIDVKLQAKQAHWNVKGPFFVGLHELFDKVAEQADEYADDIAERAVQLGGVALGTSQIVARDTTLPAYSLDAVSGREHISLMVEALAKFGTTSRQAIDAAAEVGDADTADLFTEVSRGIDKLLWMVEAHLQAAE